MSLFKNPPLRKGQKVITTSVVVSRNNNLLQKGTKGIIREVMDLGFVIEAEGKLWWVAPGEIAKR